MSIQRKINGYSISSNDWSDEPRGKLKIDTLDSRLKCQRLARAPFSFVCWYLMSALCPSRCFSMSKSILQANINWWWFSRVESIKMACSTQKCPMEMHSKWASFVKNGSFGPVLLSVKEHSWMTETNAEVNQIMRPALLSSYACYPTLMDIFCAIILRAFVPRGTFHQDPSKGDDEKQSFELRVILRKKAVFLLNTWWGATTHKVA